MNLAEHLAFNLRKIVTLIEISLSFFYPVFVVIAKKHCKLFNLFAFTVPTAC